VLVRLLVLKLLLVSTFLAAGLNPASAEQPDPKMQLLFIASNPESSAPGPVPAEIPVIAIDALPSAERAQQTVFAARLRASPVSTFVSEPNETHAQFEQFFLITKVALTEAGDGYEIGLAGETFSLLEFADRTSAVVEAFNPKNRRIGFITVTDRNDIFPLAISDVQTALNRIGFDMMVVMINTGEPDAGCSAAAAQSLHYSLVNGLADRTPFGDGDGVSTSGEVEAYLTRALNRRIARDPVCGPKYSLLIKSSNDPAQELIVYSGRSVFTEMETKLYNETFEAMFLLESDNRDSVQNFLASCLYCPNEKSLTDHLRDMEEFARADALEAEIWNKIKADTAPERLSIYLENCALCTYRSDVEGKLAEIEAKARAFDAEAKAFSAATENRDVAALRHYADDCIACAHEPEARQLVAEIEADEAYQAEKASYQTALSNRDAELMQAYLDGCDICEDREEVSAALSVEMKRAEISAPCLKLAAVPQLGGPRKLEAINQAAATRVCQAAAQEFPEDGLLRTTLGRIAQAGGNFDTAKASYDFGMEYGVPSAFGLAAYSHYAPPQGGRIDLDTAEELARQGAERGDWLSQEILTVLYSKDLVPGKTPEDAFEIAKNIADEGNPLAQFFVGYYFLTGTGVEQNDDLASVWLTKSVDQGYTHAYSFLAELHEKDEGGQALPDKAAELYWAGLLEGDPTATDRLTTQLGSRNREVVRIIQQKLRDLQVYRGSVDGIAGPGTVRAIQRYADTLTEQG